MEMSVLIQVIMLVVTGLLGIIAFFLKSIHTDFKEFKEEVAKIKTLAITIETRTQAFFSNQEQKNMIVDTRLNSHSEKIHEHDRDIAILKRNN